MIKQYLWFILLYFKNNNSKAFYTKQVGIGLASFKLYF